MLKKEEDSLNNYFLINARNKIDSMRNEETIHILDQFIF